MIYMSRELTKNLGKYITEFENYLEDKNFAEEKRTNELTEKYVPFMREMNKIIQKEIKQIK